MIAKPRTLANIRRSSSLPIRTETRFSSIDVKQMELDLANIAKQEYIQAEVARLQELRRRQKEEMLFLQHYDSQIDNDGFIMDDEDLIKPDQLGFGGQFSTERSESAGSELSTTLLEESSERGADNVIEFFAKKLEQLHRDIALCRLPHDVNKRHKRKDEAYTVESKLRAAKLIQRSFKVRFEA